MEKNPLYRCEECDHICTEEQMDADFYTLDGFGEVWSNWICPNCQEWGHDPGTSDSGWILQTREA